MRESYVVGIAAPAGGGKSTLADALAGRVADSVRLHFDDYEVTMPGDWERWLADGASFDEWSVPALAADLFEMKRSETGPPVVLFEAPLGRAHRATGDLIDFLVFIDTPLEIALARWMALRLSTGTSGEGLVTEYLANYELVLRRVYQEQRQQVRRSADLVVNGLDPVDRWVDQVLVSLPDALVRIDQ